MNNLVYGLKKAFVVAVHIAIAISLADLLALLSNNPNLEKYWPVINLLQVVVVKGIEYYNDHKNDLQLPE